ncbi:DNA adenine methylase [Winogradskyella sp. A3E31]|uniref:DNA adenine methylase n=1 Tax=Winogradskyella sp. A3E31 TaxID=3349637 RepID=UPI00398B3043
MPTTNLIKKSLESISIETLNGTNFNKNDFARKIINYPAMMVPSVQESIIKHLVSSLPNNASLIDPFMGASSTLVTAMKYGINVSGQDINPLSILISQVKTNIYTDNIIEQFNSLLTSISRSWSIKPDAQFKNINKWFKEDVQVELSQISRAIKRSDDLYFRKFCWVTLAEVIRLTSNDRTSTFKMHVRPIEEINRRELSPMQYFEKIGKRSINDLLNLKSVLQEKGLIENDSYVRNIEVKWGDSKKGLVSERIHNLLVTSPPYGDNQTTVTYGQFSYLPLQWIPVSDIDDTIDFDYLSVIQTIDKNSLGGKKANNYSEIEESLFAKSKTLKSFFDKLNKEEKYKAMKVVVFLNDLDITIDNSLNKLSDEAYLVWTVGNRNVNNREVENDKILRELMNSKRVSHITDLKRDILAKRMPEKNNFSKTMSKEKILIFKK